MSGLGAPGLKEWWAKVGKMERVEPAAKVRPRGRPGKEGESINRYEVSSTPIVSQEVLMSVGCKIICWGTKDRTTVSFSYCFGYN